MERTATIVGQGYVGLPLAQAAAKAGWKIWGLDTNAKTVEAINSGKSHVDDLSDGDIEEMISLGYEATVDPTCIANSQIVVVLSLIHISEPTRPVCSSRMPSSA